GEVEGKVQPNDAAQSRADKFEELRREQAIQLDERPRSSRRGPARGKGRRRGGGQFRARLAHRTSPAAMSRRICAPSIRSRDAASYTRDRACAASLPSAATVSRRPPAVTSFPSLIFVPAWSTHRSSDCST